MTLEEYEGWLAFFDIQHEREKAELEKAKKEAEQAARRRR